MPWVSRDVFFGQSGRFNVLNNIVQCTNVFFLTCSVSLNSVFLRDDPRCHWAIGMISENNFQLTVCLLFTVTLQEVKTEHVPRHALVLRSWLVGRA